MRKLVWFSLGFGAACCLCAYVITGSTRVILGAAVGFLTLFAAIAGRKFALFRRIAAVLLGFAMGVGWFILYDGFYLNAAGTMDGKTANAVIRVSDYSYETAYGIGVDGTVQLEGKSYRLRAYLDLDKTLEPGDTVSGQFRFRATTPKENRTYHAGNGIFLLAYQVDEVSVSPHAGASWRDFPARLRHRIQAILQTCIPQDAAPFARALLLGDTTSLSYAVDTSLKISGIRHVAAVSGLHVSILFALLTAITFRKRFLTALVGFPMLLLFAAVAGFTPSVSRSCIMCGLMLAALLLNKEYDGPAALSFAAVVMLTGNPLVITSVGFQLSVASVAGIYLFSPGIRKWLLSLFPDGKGKGVRPALIRWFTASVSITLSAMIFTTPLSAWYFGTVSLVGVVTNLLTLWVISFIFYGLVAVSLVGAFWTGGAMILGKIAAWPIRYVLLIAKLLAGFPLAAVYTRSHLAGGRVYIAAGVPSEPESPPGRSALLRHAGAVSGAAGILGGADAGQHPDNGAGCGAGAVYSAAKRRPDIHGGLRRGQRHRNCGHCCRNAPESGDLPAGRLDSDPWRPGSHRRGGKSLKPGESGHPHPPTGGRYADI